MIVLVDELANELTSFFSSSEEDSQSLSHIDVYFSPRGICFETDRRRKFKHRGSNEKTKNEKKKNRHLFQSMNIEQNKKIRR